MGVPLTTGPAPMLPRMCDPISAIAGGGLLGGALLGQSQQKKALRAQERAQQQALAASQKTQADAQKAEANARRTPNFNAIFDRSSVAPGATVLTGAGGVSNGLTLARNSLLGS